MLLTAEHPSTHTGSEGQRQPRGVCRSSMPPAKAEQRQGDKEGQELTLRSSRVME